MRKMMKRRYAHSSYHRELHHKKKEEKVYLKENEIKSEKKMEKIEVIHKFKQETRTMSSETFRS